MIKIYKLLVILTILNIVSIDWLQSQAVSEDCERFSKLFELAKSDFNGYVGKMIDYDGYLSTYEFS
jgi:hypothetical protein